MKAALLTSAVAWVTFVCIPAGRTETKEEFIKSHQESHDEIVRTLTLMHGGFIAYMRDHGGSWPQFVPEDDEISVDAFVEFWIDALDDYGVPREVWTHTKATGFSYMPALFEETPLNAFNWGTQPWVVTQGLHRGVTYMLLPDGRVAIMPFDDDLFPKGDDPDRREVEPAPVPRELRRFQKGAKASQVPASLASNSASRASMRRMVVR